METVVSITVELMEVTEDLHMEQLLLEVLEVHLQVQEQMVQQVQEVLEGVEGLLKHQVLRLQMDLQVEQENLNIDLLT